MSDALVTAAPPPAISHQKRSAKGKSIAGRVTGKLRVAVLAMAQDGLDYQQAAAKAGLTTRAVRLAFDRPHVKRFYNEQIQVFLESERARNFHRAVWIRDNSENHNAGLNAAKWLNKPDADERRQSAGARSVSPGVVVQVNVTTARGDVDQTVIEVNPVGVPEPESPEDSL